MPSDLPFYYASKANTNKLINQLPIIKYFSTGTFLSYKAKRFKWFIHAWLYNLAFRGHIEKLTPKNCNN